MSATRWLCWCCGGDGYRPHCTSEGMVNKPCDECDGRGWYTYRTGKPGHHLTLAEYLHDAHLRAATCGECRYFVPSRAGRARACTFNTNEAYSGIACMATDEGCRAGLKPEPVAPETRNMMGVA